MEQIFVKEQLLYFQFLISFFFTLIGIDIIIIL